MSTPLYSGVTHFISLSQAIAMTKKFRDEKENILIPELHGMGILPICESFNREVFDTILGQNGCMGIRCYLGMGPDLKVRLIIVGVNAENEDMLPPQTNLVEGDGGNIGEDGIRCPTVCPPGSPLNED